MANNIYFKKNITACGSDLYNRLSVLTPDLHIERVLVKDNLKVKEEFRLVLTIHKNEGFEKNPLPYFAIYHSQSPDVMKIKNIDDARIRKEKENDFKVLFEIEKGKTESTESKDAKYILDLREDEICGFGFIVFYDGETFTSNDDLKNRFNYFTLFTRKKEFVYSTIRKRNKLLISMDLPKDVKTSLKFDIYCSQGTVFNLDDAKKLVKEDVKNAKKDLEDPTFEVKPRSISKKTIVKTINLSDDFDDELDTFYLKLSQSYRSYSNYIVLRRKLQKKKKDTFYSLDKHEVLCPFCFNKKDSSDKKNLNEDESSGSKRVQGIPSNVLDMTRKKEIDHPLVFCDGSKSSVKIEFNQRPKRDIVCCIDNSYEMKHDGDDKKRSYPYLVIPNQYLKNKNRNINMSIMGMPGVGKTVYLSSLLGLQNGKKASLELLNNSLSNYGLSFSLNHLNKVVIKDKDETHFYSCEQAYSDYPSDNDEPDPFEIFKFDSSKGRTGFTAQTSTQMTFLPFILSSSITDIVVSDIAGEDLIKRNNERKRNNLQFERVMKPEFNDCIMLLVEENNFYKDEKDDNIETELMNLTNYVVEIAKKKKDIPIAVILSKFDRFILEHKLEFDSNCACLRNDTFYMSAGTYEGSALEETIDTSSEEIKNIIQKTEFGSEFLSRLEGLGNIKFENVKFFGISSIYDPTNDEETDTTSYISEAENDTQKGRNSNVNILNYQGSAFRLIEPLIWIMYKTHIIS